MTERSAIETLIIGAYEARVRGDLDGVMTAFHPECRFQFMGAADSAPICRPFEGCDVVREQMAGLIDSFAFAKFETLGLVVEGNRAAYHWRADVTFVPTGRTDNFDVVDLLVIEDGKVRSLSQFTDTAGLARLAAA
jgi:ketosteroid isomerase-like protein